MESTVGEISKEEVLKWKNKINTVLHALEYCGICLEEKEYMFDIKATVDIAKISPKYGTTFQEIISNLCSYSSEALLANHYLCEECAQIILQSVIFISNIKTSANILKSCLKNIEDHIDYTLNTVENFDDYTKSLICFDLEKIIQMHAHEEKTYNCSVCALEFDNEMIYTKHVAFHNSNDKQEFIAINETNKPKIQKVKTPNSLNHTECKYCRVWIKNSEYSQHNKSHEQRTWHCSDCDKVFYSESSFSTHLIMRHNIFSKDDIFSCKLCFKGFFTKDILNKHECKYRCPECTEVPCHHEDYLISYRDQKEAGLNVVQCPHCDFKCSRKVSLVSHVNLDHLNSFKHICDECSQSFHTKHSLTQHRLKLHPEAHTCEYCDEIFKGKKIFLEHQYVCKQIQRNFKCDLCVATFDHENSLISHKIKHDNINCSVCDNTFKNDDDLNIHIRNAHKTKIACSMCSEDFDSQGEYRLHTATHPPDSKHICRLCDMTFNCKFNHRTHLMSSHSATNKKVCTICGKTISRCHMKYHMEMHTNMKSVRKKVKHVKKVCKCDLCDKWFSSVKVLKRHKQKHKEEVQCEICNKFLRPSNLEVHLLNHKHKSTGHKKLKCDQCDYETNYPLCLDAHHNRMHMHVRPYKCPTCEKAFYGKITLHEHLKCHTDTTVTGRQCDHCGEYFCNSFSLKTHMRLHTGEKPYACEVCNDRFISASRKREHILKRHTTPTIPCPVCKNMYYSARDVRAHVKKIHFNVKKGNIDLSQLNLSENELYIFKDQRVL